MEILDESCDAFDPDWTKMASRALKAGFAEGKHSAQESLFQQGFDAGFELGFQSGYHMGSVQGYLKLSGNIQNNETGEIKNIAMKGNCEICKNDTLLLKESIDEVSTIQKDSNNIVLHQFQRKYGAISNMF